VGVRSHVAVAAASRGRPCTPRGCAPPAAAAGGKGHVERLARHVAARLRPQQPVAKATSNVWHAMWLRASGRRPCVPRLAARVNGWTMRRDLPCACIRFCMGAAAGGALSRPAARRGSYATWLRASGRRPCVLRPAARARSSPCLENALSLAHAGFAFDWAQRPEARCHGLRRDAAATPRGCAPSAAGRARRVPRRVSGAAHAARLALRLHSLCMGAAARGTLSRPAARCGSYATWLRASGRRPCVPRLAARARSSPCGETCLALVFALHGGSGQRHAVTACRETPQPRHVAARLLFQGGYVR